MKKQLEVQLYRHMMLVKKAMPVISSDCKFLDMKEGFAMSESMKPREEIIRDKMRKQLLAKKMKKAGGAKAKPDEKKK